MLYHFSKAVHFGKINLDLKNKGAGEKFPIACHWHQVINTFPDSTLNSVCINIRILRG